MYKTKEDSRPWQTLLINQHCPLGSERAPNPSNLGSRQIKLLHCSTPNNWMNSPNKYIMACGFSEIPELLSSCPGRDILISNNTC